MDNIMVDIVCITYNHGKYLRKTLDGMLMQKTNFKYRIIVHEDVSVDDTANIVREYAEKYPDIIVPIIQKENQYSKGVHITQKFIVPLIKAKYVALCEGDDYWVDDTKLQKQVDVLEKHSDCYMCVHKTQMVNADESFREKTYPNFELEEGVLSSKYFLSLGYAFQTSSYFFRGKEFVEYNSNYPKFREISKVGDECYLLYFGQLGNVYYINQTMSHYRRGVLTSWTVKQAKIFSPESLYAHYNEKVEMFTSFNEFTNGKYIDSVIERMSLYLFRKLIIEKKVRCFFQKENISFFKALSIKIKIYSLYAVVFPNLARNRFLGNMKKAVMARGYL